MSEYLYVCHFSNGHIKVGRSVDPKSRIASHADRVSCVGIELIEHHIAECVGHSIPAEAALIEKCTELASKRLKNEWFQGLEFTEVCEFANQFANTPFGHCEHPKSGLREYLDSLPHGQIVEFAKKVGVSKVYLSQLACRQDGREPSPALCVVIEKASGGAVTRIDMRPNDWQAIWPELAADTL